MFVLHEQASSQEKDHAKAAEALERVYERKLWIEAKRFRELFDLHNDTGALHWQQECLNACCAEATLHLTARNLLEEHREELSKLNSDLQHKISVALFCFITFLTASLCSCATNAFASSR